MFFPHRTAYTQREIRRQSRAIGASKVGVRSNTETYLVLALSYIPVLGPHNYVRQWDWSLEPS